MVHLGCVEDGGMLGYDNARARLDVALLSSDIGSARLAATFR
jgi:hypothetical protein